MVELGEDGHLLPEVSEEEQCFLGIHLLVLLLHQGTLVFHLGGSEGLLYGHHVVLVLPPVDSSC